MLKNRFAISSAYLDQIPTLVFYKAKQNMTQPVDNEQSRVDEQLADAPSPSGEAMLDVLFDPMGHDPISDKEVEAYVAFLKGLPQSCTEIPLAKDRMMMCFETYRGIGISVSPRNLRQPDRKFPPLGVFTSKVGGK